MMFCLLTVLGMNCSEEMVAFYCQHVQNVKTCVGNETCECIEGYRISLNRTACEEGV